MARARAVETRIEKLLPSVEEYYHVGFFSSMDAIKELMDTRTHHEYKLIAKPLLYLDVQAALQFELELEAALSAYLRQNQIKKKLKHRWAIVERIEYIYKIGLKHLRKQIKNDAKHPLHPHHRKEYDKLRREYITFLQTMSRSQSLSYFFAEQMALFPTDAVAWAEAALHECFHQRNVQNARLLLQKALLLNENKILIWKTYLRVELEMVSGMLRRLAAERREELRKKRAQRESTSVKKEEDEETSNETEAAHVIRQLESENEAFKQVIFDLSLAQSVIEESFESAVGGPEWLQVVLELLTHRKKAPHQEDDYNDLDYYYIDQHWATAGDGSTRDISLVYLFTRPLVTVAVKEANRARQKVVEECIAASLHGATNTNTSLITSPYTAGKRLEEEKRRARWGIDLSKVSTALRLDSSKEHYKNGESVLRLFLEKELYWFYHFTQDVAQGGMKEENGSLQRPVKSPAYLELLQCPSSVLNDMIHYPSYIVYFNDNVKQKDKQERLELVKRYEWLCHVMGFTSVMCFLQKLVPRPHDDAKDEHEQLKRLVSFPLSQMWSALSEHVVSYYLSGYFQKGSPGFPKKVSRLAKLCLSLSPNGEAWLTLARLEEMVSLLLEDENQDELLAMFQDIASYEAEATVVDEEEENKGTRQVQKKKKQNNKSAKGVSGRTNSLVSLLIRHAEETVGELLAMAVVDSPVSFSDAQHEALPPVKKQKPELLHPDVSEELDEAASRHREGFTFPVSLLAPLLIGEDKEVLLAAPSSRAGGGKPLSVNTLLEQFYYYMDSEKAKTRPNTDHDSTASDKNVIMKADELLEKKWFQQKLLFQLLLNIGLVSSDRLLSSKNNKNGNTKSNPKQKKGRVNRKRPHEATEDEEAVQWNEADMETAITEALLHKKRGIQFISLSETPIECWKLFYYLDELFDARKVFHKGKGNNNNNSSEESSSSDDDDEERDKKLYYSCFTEAGLRFLFSVPHILEGRSTQQNHLHALQVIEGVYELVFAHVRRETNILSSVITVPSSSSSLSSDPKEFTIFTKESCFEFFSSIERPDSVVASVESIFEVVLQHGQPPSRALLVYILLPFYEGVLLALHGRRDHPSNNNIHKTRNPPHDLSPLRQRVVTRVRRLYEGLLKLYTLSQHLTLYPPLQFPFGKSIKPSELQIDDYLHYIQFERHINHTPTAVSSLSPHRWSEDNLLFANQLVERGRKECLDSQGFLVRLNTL